SSRRRHTRFSRDWSSDVCSSDLGDGGDTDRVGAGHAVRTARLERVEQRLLYRVLLLAGQRLGAHQDVLGIGVTYPLHRLRLDAEIGRAACRGRGEQLVLAADWRW